ncbi:MAG: Demethylspheroidene O-methyltransferase [Syntrophaceae bacterium PtaU1.Bin231]|nr:MAG: Demethylspheroidene O-methyltransferase [Syntrophaceae bacterium PtaU1.Bin231]
MTDRKGPNDILRMARGFMESRILLSGAELDLFTLLQHTPLGVEEAARKTGAEPRRLAILLDALAAMGLLVKSGDTYRTADDMVPLLSADSPRSVLPMVLHMVHIWNRWSGLTRILTSGDVPSSGENLFGDPRELRAFIGAMNVVAEPMAPGIIEAVAPGRAKRLLDVGGASGTYTIAFLRATPGMKATLFDRPGVIEMARERIRAAGLLDRVDLVAGDFYRDEFPPGHDLAFLSAIIHQNSPAENRDLFGKVFRALEKEGRAVVRDHIMEPDRTRPKEGAIFAVNMLVATSGGGTYTYDEIAQWLRETGFDRVRLVRKGERMDGIVEAVK